MARLCNRHRKAEVEPGNLDLKTPGTELGPNGGQKLPAHRKAFLIRLPD